MAEEIGVEGVGVKLFKLHLCIYFKYFKLLRGIYAIISVIIISDHYKCGHIGLFKCLPSIT